MRSCDKRRACGLKAAAHALMGARARAYYVDRDSDVDWLGAVKETALAPAAQKL